MAHLRIPEGLERRLVSVESRTSDLQVSVKDVLFGAVGDGVADDTAAIAAAIEAARTEAHGNALGAEVFFPPGEYKITSQITVPYNVRLRGAGSGEYLNANGATTIKSTYNGVSVLVQAGRYGWGISDLNITGDTSLASQDLLVIGEGNNTLPSLRGKVERVYVSKAGRDNIVLDDALHVHMDTVASQYAKRYGLRVEGQSNSNKFTKCNFRQNDQWGVYWKGGRGVMDACTIEANSRHATISYGGLWVDPNDADTAANINLNLIGCHFEFNAGLAGAGKPLEVTSGPRSVIVTETGCNYSETDATRQCVIADGQFTSIGIETNLTTHADVNGATSAVFIHPTKVGAGNFAISDAGTIGIIVGSAGTMGSGLPGGGFNIGGVKLYRFGTGRLRLDTARYEAIRAASTDGVFAAFVTGNTIERLLVHASGKLHWSDGTTIDTTLERLAANQLALGTADLLVNTAGRGVRVKEGSNAKQGTATLVAGTVTVANTSVTATSRILLTGQDNNVTGALRVSARVAGTSFTITSSNAADTGVVAFEIFEPA